MWNMIKTFHICGEDSYIINGYCKNKTLCDIKNQFQIKREKIKIFEIQKYLNNYESLEKTVPNFKTMKKIIRKTLIIMYV